MQVIPVGDRVSAPRQRQPWVPPRRTIGTIGLGVAAAGIGNFLWLVGQLGPDSRVTARHTATAVAILAGLQIARWAFDSQAAANRRAAERDDLADVEIRQVRILARQEEMMAQMPSRTDLSREIRTTVTEAVAEAHVGGYMSGVRRRLGGGGHLRSVGSDE